MKDEATGSGGLEDDGGAHTPGQNMLLGMSGHDSGRLITSSRSGKQRQPCGCFSQVF